MEALSTGLLVLAYVLAAAEIALQDKGNYPSSPGRTGLRLAWRQHPWLLAGAACGIAGTIVAVL